MMTQGQGGSVVNTASVGGLLAFPTAGPYVASKHAVAVKSLLSLICEQPVFTGDPSIVKCVVEPSEGFESEWYDPLHLVGLAEVCLDECRRSAVAFDLIDEQSPLALPPSCDDYLST
jgi:hypothetical protein